jgi:1-phosphofructokinase family hexose kinase
MIVTVTLNPAYDITYEVTSMNPGDVHRVSRVRRRPGGKGINVAAVLAQLEEPVVVTGLADEQFANHTEELGLRTAFVHALPSVRSTVTVVEPGRTTSLWEPGVAPSDPEAVSHLIERLDQLLPQATCLVVSGSVPPGVPTGTPARIARLASSRGVPTVVDTSGQALVDARSVPGVVLMPNADELRELVGPTHTLTEVARASAVLVGGGAGAVFATRGSDGLLLTAADGSWHVLSPRAAQGNATGAGDAAAAAVARGLAHHVELTTIACDAVALAAAAVAAPIAGTFDADVYQQLRPAVSAQSLRDVPEAAG